MRTLNSPPNDPLSPKSNYTHRCQHLHAGGGNTHQQHNRILNNLEAQEHGAQQPKDWLGRLIVKVLRTRKCKGICIGLLVSISALACTFGLGTVFLRIIRYLMDRAPWLPSFMTSLIIFALGVFGIFLATWSYRRLEKYRNYLA